MKLSVEVARLKATSAKVFEREHVFCVSRGNGCDLELLAAEARQEEMLKRLVLLSNVLFSKESSNFTRCFSSRYLH